MKDYTKFMKWAVVYFIDRKTQDDRKSKLNVEALFSSPVQAENNYITRNDVKRYILHVDDLDRFEEFYNFLQDLKTKYGKKAIYHLDEQFFAVEEENKFRQLLNAWTDLEEIA
jgi:hypothetical protein